MSDDPNYFFHKNIHKAKRPSEHSEIHASSLEGDIIHNLKLLKSLMRGERARLDAFISKDLSSKEQKDTAIHQMQTKIIEEFLSLETSQLAQVVVPKKLQEDCFDLLIQAWRKKIYNEYSQTLTLLDLQFSRESFRAFVIALSLNVTLKALRLDRCDLDPFKIKLLAVFIKVHPSVTVLHLDENPVKDEGFKSLQAALIHNDTIVHLSCNRAQLTDKSQKCLENLLKKGIFKSISLKENAFSDLVKKELSFLAEKKVCELTFE